jgi:serine/threonine protein kinase
MQFSEQFRYLFDGMVEPDPERRFSLLEVLQHPWIQQETMKEDDFALEV